MLRPIRKKRLKSSLRSTPISARVWMTPPGYCRSAPLNARRTALGWRFTATQNSHLTRISAVRRTARLAMRKRSRTGAPVFRRSRWNLPAVNSATLIRHGAPAICSCSPPEEAAAAGMQSMKDHFQAPSDFSAGSFVIVHAKTTISVFSCFLWIGSTKDLPTFTDIGFSDLPRQTCSAGQIFICGGAAAPETVPGWRENWPKRMENPPFSAEWQGIFPQALTSGEKWCTITENIAVPPYDGGVFRAG